MALTIRKKDEPRTIERVKVTIYGDAGLGKTTLAMTAKNALLLDFDVDHGSDRAALSCDTFYVDKWEDLKNLKREDYTRYDVIIIDTVGWAINKLADDILEKYPSMGNSATGGFIPEGWSALSNRWKKFLNTLLGLHKDIVMLAHAEEKQGKKETVIRIDTMGKAKNIVYQASDQMGYLTTKNGKSVILWHASASSFGKNTAELPDTEVPSCFVNPHIMDEIIQLTKTRMTEKQSVKEADAKLGEEIREAALQREANDTHYFNELVKKHGKDQENKHIQRLILHLARNNGLEWSKEDDRFIVAGQDELAPEEDEHETGAPAATEEEKPKPEAKKPATKTRKKGSLKIGGKK